MSEYDAKRIRFLVLAQFVFGAISIHIENWRGAAIAGACLLATIAVLLTMKRNG